LWHEYSDWLIKSRAKIGMKLPTSHLLCLCLCDVATTMMSRQDMVSIGCVAPLRPVLKFSIRTLLVGGFGPDGLGRFCSRVWAPVWVLISVHSMSCIDIVSIVCSLFLILLLFVWPFQCTEIEPWSLDFRFSAAQVLLFFVVACMVHCVYIAYKRAKTFRISLLLRTVGNFVTDALFWAAKLNVSPEMHRVVLRSA
jgi:hypothetical protein